MAHRVAMPSREFVKTTKPLALTFPATGDGEPGPRPGRGGPAPSPCRVRENVGLPPPAVPARVRENVGLPPPAVPARVRENVGLPPPPPARFHELGQGSGQCVFANLRFRRRGCFHELAVVLAHLQPTLGRRTGEAFSRTLSMAGEGAFSRTTGRDRACPRTETAPGACPGYRRLPMIGASGRRRVGGRMAARLGGRRAPAVPRTTDGEGQTKCWAAKPTALSKICWPSPFCGRTPLSLCRAQCGWLYGDR